MRLLTGIDNGLSVVCDIGIIASLCYYLHSKRTGFKRYALLLAQRFGKMTSSLGTRIGGSAQNRLDDKSIDHILCKPRGADCVSIEITSKSARATDAASRARICQGGEMVTVGLSKSKRVFLPLTEGCS